MAINISEYYALRDKIIQNEFSRMNDMQLKAVFQTEGAVLILAGAGSGKTTVLVNRIAYMVKYGNAFGSAEVPVSLNEQDMDRLRMCAESGKPAEGSLAHLLAVDPCPSWRILAITFTNKAAGELKERLTRMLGEEGNEVMASTFHSFCARILRREGERLGYSSHFVIYDTDDSRRLMKECMKTLGVEDKALPHKAILGEIGRAKDSLLSPAEFAARAGSDYRLKKVAACYEMYQKRLKEADAMDFDDLLNKTVELFTKCPDVLDRYQKRYRYMMVDEYQDTNHAQYKLVSMLTERSGNLCVVGDDDQSIYKFRGATIDNILSFEDEFRGCMVIRLEQNYRSTQNILNAANAVIAQNTNRKGKTLWTENGEGDKIQLYTLDNEDEEGRMIADRILEGVGEGRKYSDYAVLYRANAQSNSIEQSLVKSGVPYRIIGGHRFFDTLEVKDAVAYLRVINNPNDSVALRRIVNQPKRGIGDTTMDNAAQIAEQLGISLYEVISHADEYASIARAAAKLKAFVTMIEKLSAQNEDEEVTVHELYQNMLEATGYLAMWKAAGETETGRVENLAELASSIKNYEDKSEMPFPDLAGFLEEAALMTDVDNYDASADTVVMMTMHAAKGLEFPVVFLPGFEDGVFPGMQILYNPDEMEEERRICYVALTRAKEQLVISRAQSRMLFGSTTRNRASRFLNDIPDTLMDIHEKTRQSYGGSQTGWTPRTSQTTASGWQNTASAATGWQSTSQGTSKSIKSAFAKPVKPMSSFAKSSETSSAGAQQWQVGDLVAHKAFGDGRIVKITPMGNDTLLEIVFSKAGTKKIMANFAKLAAR